MTKTQTLSLGQYWNNFIEEELKIGRYSSASEVVRNALRLLEEKETNSKLEMLRCALIEGEESGDAGKFDMEEIRKSAKNKIK
ncbi:MAG: type II toxin-antitoxin system ParD family antitoxin [Rickettsiales bacterium]|jgi:antitoxin ParD1/3/4|nr:type II toxin-antitoxin system ParD family antitoxin [Rickettsiales bacterium]MDA9573808.1 type II toxin-antitoxin system ParD family antitoxin [Rickettsiales bacterium]|tara:strand:+ start:1004 stop:1252 length:249 start_codon:yes stop_codon:yes gene_type:complete